MLPISAYSSQFLRSLSRFYTFLGTDIGIQLLICSFKISWLISSEIIKSWFSTVNTPACSSLLYDHSNLAQHYILNYRWEFHYRIKYTISGFRPVSISSWLGFMLILVAISYCVSENLTGCSKLFSIEFLAQWISGWLKSRLMRISVVLLLVTSFSVLCR